MKRTSAVEVSSQAVSPALIVVDSAAAADRGRLRLARSPSMPIFARRAQGVGVRQVMVRLEASCIADELNAQPSKNAFIFFMIWRDDPSFDE
jgi:hypothetical protein